MFDRAAPPPVREAAKPRIRRVDVEHTAPELRGRLQGRGHWLWVGGPLPKHAAGLTLGSLVIVKRHAEAASSFSRLLQHEQIHVAQFREQGVLRFVWTYVLAYLRLRASGWDGHGAYRRIPHEVEARARSRA